MRDAGMSCWQRSRFGELETIQFDASDGRAEPRSLVVLCHGYGAPGDDLAPLGPELVGEESSAASPGMRFLFPAAPIDMTDLGLPGGRAWWPLNMARLMALTGGNRIEAMFDETPPGLNEACDQLDACVRAAAADFGVPLDRVVLGGFSQGSMIAVDLAARWSEQKTPPAGLAVLSGLLISQAHWKRRFVASPGRPVFQSHGRYDDVLPFSGAAALRDALNSVSWPVEFVEFSGGHGIPPIVLDSLSQYLGQRFDVEIA